LDSKRDNLEVVGMVEFSLDIWQWRKALEV